MTYEPPVGADPCGCPIALNLLAALIRQLLAAGLIFASQIAFAQGLSKNCVNELMAIPEKNANFDLQNFSKDLVTEIVKVKAQMKLPFGKPADSKMTDIGMTVGCLKAFPENPAGILALFKDIGFEAAKGVAANKLGASSTASGSDDGVIKGNEASRLKAGISGGNAAVAANKSPALKECDAIFNPGKKFCYDGGIYDLCDGMSYNPTTHICSGDIANRALCNGAQYNPLKQKCENNTIIAKCGATEYNPATHGCNNNILYPVCGTKLYNPKMYGCKDNVLLAKCGEAYYDQATHECKDNAVVVLPSCGAKFYNPEKHICKDNVLLAKCGAKFYNPETNGCKDNVVLSSCGATEYYNPAMHECRFGAVVAK